MRKRVEREEWKRKKTREGAVPSPACVLRLQCFRACECVCVRVSLCIGE